MMHPDDLLAVLPFLVMGVAVIVVMLVIAFRRRHGLAVGLSLLGIILSLAALGPASSLTPREVTPLFTIDGYTLFFIGLILVATIAVLLLSYGYFEARRGPREEFYLLILLATFGAMTLVASTHFASFFVGLETLSISLLGLIAYPRNLAKPVEAGFKYLILAGASSAFLLFGMALIYARLGTMQFNEIAVLLRRDASASDVYWLTGLAMIITGIGFKLSLVPFHMWAPDVYEGAPAPVTAFVAVVSKGAVFALLLRYFLAANVYGSGSLIVVINVIAVLSIVAGNLLALLQNNLKRILAYSSIAHLGYLLVALLAGGTVATEAVAFYLVAYFVMTLGAFGVVTVLSASSGDQEIDLLEDYRGLLWRRPWLGAVLTAMLLSLAGIPLTVGFLAKFFAVMAGVSAAMWAPVFALVAGSIIGLFYYLRVIVRMTLSVPDHIVTSIEIIPWSGSAILATLSVFLVWLGIYPSPLLRLIELTTLHMGPH